MRTYGWFTRGALLLCLGVMGCEASEREESSEQQDELNTAESELKRPRKPWVRRDAGASEENPCALLDCRDGQRCELKPVWCIKAPCPEVATCVPGESQLSCDNLRCAAGTHCEDGPRGASCVPDASSCSTVLCPPDRVCVEGEAGASCVPVAGEPDAGSSLSCANVRCTAGTKCVETEAGPECTQVASCAATLCPVNTVCIETPEGAECVPPSPSCDLKCERGTHCELEDVVCVRAPCPPVPSCVPDVRDPCATVRCAAGTHCEAKQVQCVRAPCPPVAECVAD